MFRVLADGAGHHLLEDADGTPVGWIRGRTVGFRDIAGERQALAAAAAAWHALEIALHREFGGRPQPVPAIDQLRFAHVGESEWITDGARSIARVHRHVPGASRYQSFGIEFELPSYAHEGTAIVAAQVMGRALRERIGWGCGAARDSHAASIDAACETAAHSPTACATAPAVASATVSATDGPVAHSIAPA